MPTRLPGRVGGVHLVACFALVVVLVRGQLDHIAHAEDGPVPDAQEPRPVP